MSLIRLTNHEIIKVMRYLVLVLAFITAWHASALILTSPNDLVLSISPASPKAGQTITATAKSFAFDAARANFRWLLNGKEIASGRGLIEQTFTAGSLGSGMVIRAIATSIDGSVFETQTDVSVADIDFIIHPLAYTPAFYRGAALPTPGSVVEIIAVPHLFSGGAKLKLQNLIYEWSLDGKPVQNQSGGGKNKLVLRLADVGSSEYIVTLKTSSLGGVASTQKNIRIRTYQPEILFYEVNALTGIKPQAIVSFLGRAGNSFSILAEPFFFGLESLARAQIGWSANGEKFEQPAGKNPNEFPTSAS